MDLGKINAIELQVTFDNAIDGMNHNLDRIENGLNSIAWVIDYLPLNKKNKKKNSLSSINLDGLSLC